MIKIVSATRLSESLFKDSPLGASLGRLARDARLSAWIAFENAETLPRVYNQLITEANRADVMVFMHDDVWIDDYHFADRIREGLERFDVIGLAGNKSPAPATPAWAFANDRFEWDLADNLSGAVAHGSRPFGPVTWYGDCPAEVKTVDGLLIAAKCATLLDRSVRFDEQFEFHLYDMDFCRTAVTAGLRIGTWPIAVTHASGGAFGSPAWRAALDKYRNKWSLPDK